MRIHKQILERVPFVEAPLFQYDENAMQRAKAQAEAKFKQLQDLYGACIVEVRQAELHEMYAFDSAAYVINVWIDIPDTPLIVLPDGFLLSY